MFRKAYQTASQRFPQINVKSNMLVPDEIDQRYLDEPYSTGYTDGCGSLKNPYTYKSAAPVSAYYGVVDLWFRFHPNCLIPDDIYIKVNDWTFELKENGVIYEGQFISFV